MSDVYYYLFVGRYFYLFYGYHRVGSVQICIKKENFMSYFERKFLQYIPNTSARSFIKCIA